MSKKRTVEKKGMSKRQARLEELRKKERQQRIIIIVAIVVIAAVIIALIAIPSTQKPTDITGGFVKVTPVSYKTADGTSLGNPDAKVVIDVFEDFQCSVCQVYTKEVEPQVIAEIAEPGKVFYSFHQYSFEPDSDPNLKESDNAAMASECAAEQNRFWDYKNILFANQTHLEGQFSETRLEDFAKSLSLNMNEFKACYQQRRYQNKLDEGYNLGVKMGVTGTPTIFINGVDVSPGKMPSFELILKAVEQALAASQ